MKNLTRILSLIVLVIAALVLVLSLSGIVGVWIARGQLAADLVDVATAAERRVTRVKLGLDRLDAALTRAHDQVLSVEQEVQAFGADLEQNRPLLSAISDRLGLELGPLFDGVRELVTTVRETVTAVNSAIEAINAIPFISIPVPELEKVEKLSQDVDNVQSEVRALRTAIDERRSEIIQGSVSIITTPTSQIGRALGEMQAVVSGYNQQVGALEERLSNFRSSIGGWLTWVAVILTLILLWFALSQAAVLVLGWRFFSGRDLLAQNAQQTSTELDGTPVSELEGQE